MDRTHMESYDWMRQDFCGMQVLLCGDYVAEATCDGSGEIQRRF